MRNKPLPGLCPKESPLKMHGMLEKKTGLGPRATTKPVNLDDELTRVSMSNVQDDINEALTSTKVFKDGSKNRMHFHKKNK